jgi:hypothetical protein
MSPELSLDELLRLWESGVPFDSAWIEFAVSLDRFSFAALHTHPDDDLKIHGLHNREYKELINSGWLPRTLEGRKKKLEMITENERTHLLRDIYAGRLWAIGFQTLPSGLVEPVHVHREIFDVAGHPERRRDIDWDKHGISTGSGSFFDIRIVRPPVVENESAEPQPQQDSGLPVAEPRPDEATKAVELSAAEQPKPVQAQLVKQAVPGPQGGRPNKREQIRCKVEELWKDPLFHAIPNRTDQAREVRARLHGESARHFDDMQGYRTTQIKRIIGEVANNRATSE